MEKEAAVFRPELTVSQPRSAAAGQTLPLSLVRAGDTVRIRSVSGRDETR